MNVLLLFSLSISLLISSISDPKKYKVSIRIEGIRNGNGNVLLSAYHNEDEFDDETPFQRWTIEKTGLEDSVVNFEIELIEGTYGLALLDDENKNREMDYSWLMMPEEGFAFSDFYLEGLSKPDFEDFDFPLKGDRQTVMKIRYF